MKQIGLVILTLLFLNNITAQTVVLDEGFTNGIPTGWSTQDVDQFTPNAQVSNFTSAWIGFTSAIDTCAASTSYHDTITGASEDYLITPSLGLLSFGNLLSWESKSFDANYLETYYVLLSTTDASPASFTDTIKIIVDDAPFWKNHTVNLFELGFANQNVFIAFRNASANEYILGIDNVKLTADDPATVSESILANVKLYPNPVVNQFQIEVDEFKGYNIYNLQGQLMISGQEKSIDVSTFSQGTYYIEIKAGSGILNQKFIKI